MSYGLVVRIPAFHVGSPGSIPGVGTSVGGFVWVVGSVAGTGGDMTGDGGESGNIGAGADDT